MDTFNPLNQTITITDGVDSLPIPLTDIDTAYQQFMVSSAIALSSQIGACGMMLLVVLTMTARNRFARTTTLVNIAALGVTLVRSILLLLYYTSSWTSFYVFFSGDASLVTPADTRISMVATFLAVPQLVLVLTTLVIQAYAMIQLWQPMFKWLTLAVSAILSTSCLAFKCAVVALQLQALANMVRFPDAMTWVKQVDLALITTNIVWYCLVFLLRIVLHMWQYRSVLPPVKGLSAMDVLVMTNGVLMIIPVFFAGLQYAPITLFQVGPLVLTSVVLVVPLGSLVAQRMVASPQATSAVSKEGGRHTAQSDASRKGMLGSFSHHSTTGPKESMTSARTGRERPDAIDLELQRVDDME